MKERAETYFIEADNVRAEVQIKIVPGEFVPIYFLRLPEIRPATSAILDKIRERLLSQIAVKTVELLDPRSHEELKKRFYNMALDLIKKELKDITDDTAQFLSGSLIHEMLGLGKLELLINDGNLEEIVINHSKEPAWVFHRKYGWLKTNIDIPTEAQIENYASIIGRRVGREATILHPLMDAHLTTGDRVNATLFPISTRGNTLTIRKFRREPWTITDLIENNTISSEVSALLWSAVEYEVNILVSGGTASGKTTFLNVLMCFIPPNQRIVSIEDTREISLPSFLHWIPLTTRAPNPEGLGGIEMIDLMVNSLRMRPDRIIVGEIRRQDQAEVLFEAMHTGHSVYATLHADTAEQTYRRLTNPPINVPEAMMETLHMITSMFRDRRRGIRRIFQVAEVVPIEGAESKTMINTVYRWKPFEDRLVKQGNSMRLADELKLHAGMTDQEFDADMNEKKLILEWMVNNKVKTVDGIGKIVYEYYYNPEKVVQLAAQNQPISVILPKELLA